MDQRRCSARARKSWAFLSALEAVNVAVWRIVPGQKSLARGGRTGFLKYVSATEALSSGVYKHAPEKLPSSSP